MKSFESTESKKNTLLKIPGGWINPTKRLMYASTIIFSSLGTEAAKAAEIPREASLEEGIDILERSTVSENFETAAAFITLPDGTSYWISVEGNEESVDLFAGHAGEDAEKIISFIGHIISENSIERGEVLEIDHYHNHPMQSLISEYTGEHFSIPPSGAGFLTGGDTSFEKKEIFENAINQIEDEYGVSVDYKKHVVDALGIWTWDYVDTTYLNKNPVYKIVERYLELLQGNIPFAETRSERERLGIIMEAAISRFQDAYYNWIDNSADLDMEALDNLLESFRTVGIEMSFTPHRTE